MDAFEVLKIAGFLIAVLFFWFLFTAERDENRALKGRMTLVEAENKRLTEATTGMIGRVDARLGEWTEKMMSHKNEVDLVKREGANLVSQCKALEEKMSRKPIHVRVQNVPMEILSGSPVQMEIKKAAKNLKAGKLSK